MDFNFSEEQTMVRDLARGILEKEVNPDRVKAAGKKPDWFDAALWKTLAEAGLLGIGIPEDFGGMGFGILETCVLLQEAGRVLAVVPILPTLVLGAQPIAEFGTDAQRNDLLPGVVSGDTILTAALVDCGSADPAAPATAARKDGAGWVLDGKKAHVRAAHLAKRILVPAKTPEGVGIFLVDPKGAGVTLTRHNISSGEPLFTMELAGVRAGEGDLLGADAKSGAAKSGWILDRALAATCAMQIGVSEKTIEMTSVYVTERIQFGVPIGSFQAVQHRMADCYIDLESMRWVTWRAAWKLSEGLPASRELAAAKIWASDGGSRIASAAQHLHGGMGVDVDYPLPRYFMWSKGLELSFGSAAPHLARLGRDMAACAPVGSL